MKQKSKAKRLKRLEHQAYRLTGNPELFSRMMKRIDTVKNSKIK